MSAITVEMLDRPVRLRDARVPAERWPRPAARTADAAPLRLNGRGRAVVVTLAVLLGLAGVLGSQAANAGAPAAAVPVVTHTVAEGETLWAIASGLAAPGEDVRDVVAELVDLNGLAGAQLRAGQQILLPADR